jgi:hypothetical protein
MQWITSSENAGPTFPSDPGVMGHSHRSDDIDSIRAGHNHRSDNTRASVANMPGSQHTTVGGVDTATMRNAESAEGHHASTPSSGNYHGSSQQPSQQATKRQRLRTQ